MDEIGRSRRNLSAPQGTIQRPHRTRPSPGPAPAAHGQAGPGWARGRRRWRPVAWPAAPRSPLLIAGSREDLPTDDGCPEPVGSERVSPLGPITSPEGSIEVAALAYVLKQTVEKGTGDIPAVQPIVRSDRTDEGWVHAVIVPGARMAAAGSRWANLLRASSGAWGMGSEGREPPISTSTWWTTVGPSSS